MQALNSLCAIVLCSLKVVIPNPCPQYTLINSVDFHPEKNVFCATYTHGNKVIIYEFDDATNQVKQLQCLENPKADFHEPQHAIFTCGGKKLIVANWSNRTLAIFQKDKHGAFSTSPKTVLHTPKNFEKYRPHGMSISPCGNFLAIAYGASSFYEKAIVMLRFNEKNPEFKVVNQLKGQDLMGIPKGITFSPDGNSLLVTFSDENSLAIYDLNAKKEINANPRQIVDGEMFRPEDVKISPKGDYCAVTNSEHDTVTFYPFDSTQNQITQNEPIHTIKGLTFPHGIAFAPDGSHIAITEFGPITVAPSGDITWDNKISSKSSKVSVFEIHL